MSIKGPSGWRNQDMQLSLARTHLTRRLSVQKVCPKAIQSNTQLAAIIKRRYVLLGPPRQPANLKLTSWIRTAHENSSTGNYMLASLYSSSCSNIMPWPNHSAVSGLQCIQHSVVNSAWESSTKCTRSTTIKHLAIAMKITASVPKGHYDSLSFTIIITQT